jgi:hypothetical protein
MKGPGVGSARTSLCHQRVHQRDEPGARGELGAADPFVYEYVPIVDRPAFALGA